MLTDLAKRLRAPLIATTALCAASCAELGPDAGESQDDAVASENGFSMNGFSMNGFSMNGLETSGGLSSTTGLMTTEGGREVIKYLVKVAYPAGSSLTAQDQYGTSYTFEGSLGVAPEAEVGTCDVACQERISGAMLAHVNNSGLHVGIWLVGPDSGIGWGSSPNYPYKEAAYFGNLFAANNMTGYYCAGKDMASGNAKGRLGSPFANNANVLSSPYGWQWDAATSQNVPQYCSTTGSNNCTVMNEGYSQCADPNGGAAHPAWTHPVTVWRNFEATQLYKICNKSSGKCLGVVGGSTASGASVEQRTFSSAAGQTWKILQVSPGAYKIINKTSGMSLDLSGAQVVQKPYTNQAFPLTYLTTEPGFANLKLSSSPSVVFWNNWSASDGGLIQTTTQTTADPSKWFFIAVAPDAFDPGMTYRLVPQQAMGMSVDVCYGSTNNGTCIQQYPTWNGDEQKLFLADAGKGNVKLTMKVNRNKCIGPVANGATPGTALEIQDCNGSYNQAWITGQKTDAPGVFILRNAAAPNLCMDVTGGSGSPGARMELYTCNGAINQLFAAQVAP